MLSATIDKKGRVEHFQGDPPPTNSSAGLSQHSRRRESAQYRAAHNAMDAFKLDITTHVASVHCIQPCKERLAWKAVSIPQTTMRGREDGSLWISPFDRAL